MIDYQETKKTMEIRGIEFTKAQFSFALMVSVGINKYDAYKIAIVGEKSSKVKDDKLSEMEEKWNKECDLLLENNNVKALYEHLKEKYDYQISDEAMNCESVEITPKILKNLLGRIIKKSSDNLDNAAVPDLIRVVDQYCKQFSLNDNGDAEFSRHFIQIYPQFNYICSCGSECDAPFGLDFRCPKCGRLYKWNEDEKRYY